MKFTKEREQQLLFKIAKKFKYNPKSSILQISKELQVSRQTVHKYIKTLEANKYLCKEPQTNAYKVKPILICRKRYENTDLAEDLIYNECVRPKITSLNTECIRKIEYASQEMINNVIEHSMGTFLGVIVIEDYVSVRIVILDNGIGIFKKIKDFFNLDTLHDAMLELDKGKCTTSSSNHTGEGIFFSSKMFDFFYIQANGLTYVSGTSQHYSYLLESRKNNIRTRGTYVSMEIAKDNILPIREIFEQYTDEDEGFNKTVVPVIRLIDRKNETDMSLTSRSQARRLLHRFDRFSNVVLDFAGIDFIGQGFADEVFRVYENLHPDVHISYTNTNSQVEKMIKHAIHTK